jgi:hypothetical protein
MTFLSDIDLTVATMRSTQFGPRSSPELICSPDGFSVGERDTNRVLNDKNFSILVSAVKICRDAPVMVLLLLIAANLSLRLWIAVMRLSA